MADELMPKKCLLLVFVFSFLSFISVNAAEESLLAFKITPAEQNSPALTKQVFWVEASYLIDVFFQGGEVKLPMRKIKQISFVWDKETGKGSLILQTGETLEVEVRNLNQKLPARLHGLPQEVEAIFPVKSITSCEILNVSYTPPSPPAAGTKLFAKATRDSNTSPLVFLGQVNEDGKYAMNRQYSRQSIKLAIGGIELDCPFGSLKSAAVRNKKLQIELSDGTVLNGEGYASKIEGDFMGMDINIEDWNKAEFFWQSDEPVPQEASIEQPQSGSILVAVFTKDGITSPELVVAKMDTDGTCKGITHQSELTFQISTDAGEIDCPVSKIKSITITGEETALVTRQDGSELHGKARAMTIAGLVGKQEASVEDWNKVEFSWRSQEPAFPAMDESGPQLSWQARYFQLAALPERTFIVDSFLSNTANNAGISSLFASYKGTSLDVTEGCKKYIFSPDGSSVILKNGEELPLILKLSENVVLFTEYSPSIPARVVIPTKDIGQMVSGEDAKESTWEKDWKNLTSESPGTAWTITDIKERTYVVTNFSGYQLGRAYDSPPAGYYYIGGYYTEAALLGGQCAVIDMGKASAHIPLSVIESIDPVNGMVRLRKKETGPAEKLRGFCDPSNGEDEINNYMRTKVREYQSSVLTGDSAYGALAIPIINCTKIEQTNKLADFAVPATDKTSRTIKLQTAQGSPVLTDCLVRYQCGSFPTSDDMSKAPYYLALGKDEADDDPDEYKVAQILVTLSEGPTIAVPLRIVSSGQPKGTLMEINLVDNRKIEGTLVEGSFIGTGTLGETSVKLSDVQGFEIQR